jgi:hypothetical protein
VTKGGSPGVYRIHPFDLLGAEDLDTGAETMPLPEPGVAVGLLAGTALLAALARARSRRGAPR